MNIDPDLNIPDEEQMEELHKRFLEDLKTSKNNLSYWFPKIKECGIFNIPKTVIIPVPDDVIVSFFLEREGDMQRIRNFIHETVAPEARKFKSPPFIKNGCFSNKFNFSLCAPADINEDTLYQSLCGIQYDSLCFDTGGAAEIILRERIKAPKDLPKIYNGMPLQTEFRVFYDFDKKKPLYCANYWDRDYCLEAISRRESDLAAYEHRYPEILKEYDNNKDAVLGLSKIALEKVTGIQGIWSVDFLIDSKGKIWLIDMAEGYRSAYWNTARALICRNSEEITNYAGPTRIYELSVCDDETAQEIIAHTCDKVIRRWNKANPGIIPEMVDTSCKVVFIETVLEKDKEEIEKNLSRYASARDHMIEYYTVIACCTVAGGNVEL